jgi:hypothetical protein
MKAKTIPKIDRWDYSELLARVRLMYRRGYNPYNTAPLWVVPWHVLCR